ncbi:MAG: PadR family transcriptional regulator [Clostridiales bacterium]|nr:PadR family transcriptional regulator [Clostridiales bacterium]
MEYVILGLLMIQPSTLYSLNKSFEQGISLFFSPSLGSINSAIKRLIDKKLVAQEQSIENGRAKKILTITDMGQSAFINWMHEPLDAKNLEVSFLSRLYFLGLIEDQSQKKALVEGMYRSTVASKATLDETEIMLNTMEIPKAYQDIFHYQKKVLQYGIDTHSYTIDWIENLIKEL